MRIIVEYSKFDEDLELLKEILYEITDEFESELTQMTVESEDGKSPILFSNNNDTNFKTAPGVGYEHSKKNREFIFPNHWINTKPVGKKLNPWKNSIDCYFLMFSNPITSRHPWGMPTWYRGSDKFEFYKPIHKILEKSKLSNFGFKYQVCDEMHGIMGIIIWKA